jgi:hypothetical protein
MTRISIFGLGNAEIVKELDGWDLAPLLQVLAGNCTHLI